MINHLRTLLLNRDGTEADGSPGDEYVPPDYRAVDLPTPLRAVRAALFGGDPDRAMLNARLRQYLALVHATELAVFARALDPRMTYLPVSEGGPIPFGLRVTPLGTTVELHVGGPPPAEAGSGRTRMSWLVQAVDF